MSGGILGGYDGSGKWTESDIPGASDGSEVYDRAIHGRSGCDGPASREAKGPKGIVTWFEPDPQTASSRIEYGKAVVTVDGATTCVTIPRWQINSVSGEKHYYEWWDVCCTNFLGSFDCWVEVSKIKSEQGETEEDWTLLEPIHRCQTDWGRAAVNAFIELIKAGAGAAKGKIAMDSLLGAREDGTFARAHKRALAAALAENKQIGRRVPNPKTEGCDDEDLG